MKTVFQVSVIVVDEKGVKKEYDTKVFESLNAADRYRNLCILHTELIVYSIKLNSKIKDLKNDVVQCIVSDVKQIKLVEKEKENNFIESFTKYIKNAVDSIVDFHNFMSQ